MQGRNFCIKHGGKNPVGPANGNWKHGGHSKYMPTRLAEKYRESLEDPQLMEFRADAALLQARLHELLETGESLPLWDQAQDAFRDYRKAAQRAQQAPARSSEWAEAAAQMTEALNRLESLINRGMADSLRWQEVYRVTEQVGKTKEREHRRLVQSEMVYTAEQLLAMVGKIVDAANSTIRDTEDRRAFQAALNQFGLLADRAGTTH